MLETSFASIAALRTRLRGRILCTLSSLVLCVILFLVLQSPARPSRQSSGRARANQVLLQSLYAHRAPIDAIQDIDGFDNTTRGKLCLKAPFGKSGRIKPGQVLQVTGDVLENELEDESTPILLDVYAKWCGPCMMMVPHLEKAAKTLGRRARVLKLDSDQNTKVVQSLKVLSLPTLVLFVKSKVVDKREGYMGEKELVEFVLAHSRQK